MEVLTIANGAGVHTGFGFDPFSTLTLVITVSVVAPLGAANKSNAFAIVLGWLRSAFHTAVTL